MPDFNAVIDGFTAGDDLIVRRTIDRAASDFIAGETVTRAWMTVKSSRSDLDADALVQKDVTTSDVAGTGQVENDGTGDVDPVVRFDLVGSDTEGLTRPSKYYDIQLKTSENRIVTVEVGTILAETQVTLSS